MDPRKYAEAAHAGQLYGSEPYMVHLEAVAAIVSSVTDSEDARAVAYLHDVLEDTEATGTDLTENFGTVIAVAVSLVTDPEGHPNRKTRKAELHRRLGALQPTVSLSARWALLVKAADRLANLRACVVSGDSRLHLYQREHAAFRDAAYRPGLCDVTWTEINLLGVVTK